jgi:hypothetical protein
VALPAGVWFWVSIFCEKAAPALSRSPTVARLSRVFFMDDNQWSYSQFQEEARIRSSTGSFLSVNGGTKLCSPVLYGKPYAQGQIR